MASKPRGTATSPSIFLRLKESDPAPREFAWDEFSNRYGPIIASFARRLGGRPQDVEDVVQDVLLGFFLASPTFVYDPRKGKFRSYLKVCTYRALRQRLGRDAKFHDKPFDEIEPEEMAIDQAWNDVWEQERLRYALDQVRASMGQTRTFQAFELYVIFDHPPQAVADKLGIHLNSVYRAKEQITLLLREKVIAMQQEED